MGGRGAGRENDKVENLTFPYSLPSLRLINLRQSDMSHAWVRDEHAHLSSQNCYFKLKVAQTRPDWASVFILINNDKIVKTCLTWLVLLTTLVFTKQ